MTQARRNGLEIRGKTVDEAVLRALSQLKLPRSQVEVAVLEEGRPGIFGVGATSALVRVTPKGDAQPTDGSATPLPRIDDYADSTEADPSERPPSRGRRGRRGGRGRGRAAPDEAPGSDDSPNERDDASRDADDHAHSDRQPSANRSRPRHRGGRGRGRRGGGERGANDDRGGSSRGRGRGPRRDRPNYPTPPIQLEAFDLLADPEFEPEEDPRTLAVNIVTDLLHLMGVRANVEARDPETAMDGLNHSAAVIDVKPIDADDDLSLLVGPGGEHLIALQYVTNVLLSRALDGENPVTVDVDGYKRRREDELNTIASESAASVREAKDAIELEPMTAAERRIIHLALSEEDDVETESEGEGDARRVVIVYRGDE